jgi:hypothetical protein
VPEGLIDNWTEGPKPRLSVEEGAPGVQILRWYLGPKDKLLEFTIDVHPAEHFYNRTRTHRGAL